VLDRRAMCSQSGLQLRRVCIHKLPTYFSRFLLCSTVTLYCYSLASKKVQNFFGWVVKNKGVRGVGGTPRCLFSYTYVPPAQGGGGGGQNILPPPPPYIKKHVFVRVSGCNSVLVCDQMGSETRKKRDAAVTIHHYKAEQRSRIIYYRGKATTFECDSIVDNCFQLS
jgi:hypothetical protein